MKDKKKQLQPDESPKWPRWPRWPRVSVPSLHHWRLFDRIVLAYGFCLVFIGGPYAVVNFILCFCREAGWLGR
jgi:hypothetical protein